MSGLEYITPADSESDTKYQRSSSFSNFFLSPFSFD